MEYELLYPENLCLVFKFLVISYARIDLLQLIHILAALSVEFYWQLFLPYILTTTGYNYFLWDFEIHESCRITFWATLNKVTLY